MYRPHRLLNCKICNERHAQYSGCVIMYGQVGTQNMFLRGRVADPDASYIIYFDLKDIVIKTMKVRYNCDVTLFATVFIYLQTRHHVFRDKLT